MRLSASSTGLAISRNSSSEAGGTGPEIPVKALRRFFRGPPRQSRQPGHDPRREPVSPSGAKGRSTAIRGWVSLRASRTARPSGCDTPNHRSNQPTASGEAHPERWFLGRPGGFLFLSSLPGKTETENQKSKEPGRPRPPPHRPSPTTAGNQPRASRSVGPLRNDGPPSLRHRPTARHQPLGNQGHREPTARPTAPRHRRLSSRSPAPTPAATENPEHGMPGFAAPRIAPCLLVRASRQAACRGRSSRPSHSGTGSRRELLSRQETRPRGIQPEGREFPERGDSQSRGPSNSCPGRPIGTAPTATHPSAASRGGFRSVTNC